MLSEAFKHVLGNPSAAPTHEDMWKSIRGESYASKLGSDARTRATADGNSSDEDSQMSDAEEKDFLDCSELSAEIKKENDPEYAVSPRPPNRPPMGYGLWDSDPYMPVPEDYVPPRIVVNDGVVVSNEVDMTQPDATPSAQQPATQTASDANSSSSSSSFNTIQQGANQPAQQPALHNASAANNNSSILNTIQPGANLPAQQPALHIASAANSSNVNTIQKGASQSAQQPALHIASAANNTTSSSVSTIQQGANLPAQQPALHNASAASNSSRVNTMQQGANQTAQQPALHIASAVNSSSMTPQSANQQAQQPAAHAAGVNGNNSAIPTAANPPAQKSTGPARNVNSNFNMVPAPVNQSATQRPTSPAPSSAQQSTAPFQNAQQSPGPSQTVQQSQSPSQGGANYKTLSPGSFRNAMQSVATDPVAAFFKKHAPSSAGQTALSPSGASTVNSTSSMAHHAASQSATQRPAHPHAPARPSPLRQQMLSTPAASAPASSSPLATQNQSTPRAHAHAPVVSSPLSTHSSSTPAANAPAISSPPATQSSSTPAATAPTAKSSSGEQSAQKSTGPSRNLNSNFTINYSSANQNTSLPAATAAAVSSPMAGQTAGTSALSTGGVTNSNTSGSSTIQSTPLPGSKRDHSHVDNSVDQSPKKYRQDSDTVSVSVSEKPGIAAAKTSTRNKATSRANTPTPTPLGGGQTQGDASAPQSMPFNHTGSSSFNFTPGNNVPAFGQNGSSTDQPPNNPFGSMSSTPAQQNGSGSFQFGNTNTSFGSTPSFGASNQPQQNGTSTSAFGQPQASSAPQPAFGGFGQNQPAPTSFTGFGQNQTQQSGFATGATNNSFGSAFGQPQQNTQQSTQPSQPSFSGFGASQSQQQNSQSTPSTSFGGFGHAQQNTGTSFGQSQQIGGNSIFTSGNPAESSTAPGNLFGGSFTQAQGQQTQNQVNGDQPTNIFGAAPQSNSTPTPSNTSNLFGQQSMNASSQETAKPAEMTKSTGLFGSSQPPPSTPNLGNSILGGLNQDRASQIKPGMFTSSQNTSSTPQPTNNNNMFAPAQSTQQTADTTAGAANPSTTQSSNIFGQSSLSQANGVKSSLFAPAKPQEAQQQHSTQSSDGNSGSHSLSQFGQQEAPKAGSLSTWGSNSSQQPQQSTTPGVSFGKTQEDTSMASPNNNTPQKGTNLHLPKFPPFPGTAQPAPAQSEDAGKQKTSLFGSSTSMSTQSTNALQATAPAAGQGKSLFERITPATQAPAESSTTKSSTPTVSITQHSTVAPNSTTPADSATSTNNAPVNDLTDTQKGKMLFLNNGFIAFMNEQDPTYDWSAVFKHYLKLAAEIREDASPITSAQATPKASSLTTQKSTTFGSNAANATTPMKQASGPADLLQPPNTAPANARKRTADDEPQQPPATEKRPRQNEAKQYAPLPSSASNAAKLFQSVYDSGRSESPAKDSSSSATAAAAPKPAGFNAVNTSSPAPPTFAAPAAGTGGFLSAFGKKATAQVETEKKKRKAADYDSDEDNEAEWEEKDRQAQEAKKQKLADAGKAAAGFTFAGDTPEPAESAKTPGFGYDGTSDVAPATSQTPKPAAGGSLFARATSREAPATVQPAKTQMFDFAKTGSASSTAGTSIFSGAANKTSASSNMFKSANAATTKDSDKTEGEKEQGSGDHTWNPNTPVKFGGTSTSVNSFTPATAPPKNPQFGSLFGANTATSTSSGSNLNVPSAKPNPNFTFGGAPSLATSRATTPGGVTTDGEGASSNAGGADNDDGEAAPPEKQMEDQTALRDEEKEHEDLLFSVAVAKASKLVDDKKDPETGALGQGWTDRGKGPLYILKHRDTGKTRVILKVKPLGRAAMNFEPLKGIEYFVAPNGKSVRGAFQDYLDVKDKASGKVTSWLIQVKEAKDAKEIERLLNEGRPT